LIGVAVEKLLLETVAAEAAATDISDVPDKIDVIITIKIAFVNAFLNRCTYIVTYLCFHKEIHTKINLGCVIKKPVSIDYLIKRLRAFSIYLSLFYHC